MKLHAPSTEDLSYCLQTSITSPSFLIQLMVPWVSLYGLFLLYKWLTAFRSNKQTNLSISISLENTSLFFNSFYSVFTELKFLIYNELLYHFFINYIFDSVLNICLNPGSPLFSATLYSRSVIV